MSSPRRWLPSLALACALALPTHAARAAPADAPPDRSLSPYFVVEGAADPKLESLPLESTHADVHIAGVIADVTVAQVYRNDGDRTISARYVFPASTRAAVYGMKMTIGDRVIVAKIKEREQARQEYEAAKREGKTASLLEEDRPNVFSMNVANILPKDRIVVELKYTELLVPTDGVYELAYPAVVGPRYVSPSAAHGDSHDAFTATPYQHAGQAAPYKFGVTVDLAAGMTIQSIDSPSHVIATHWASDHHSATVDLDGDDPTAGTKDFLLRYRLAGEDLASGLMLFPGAKESFFLMMVQPPRRPAPDAIPPREYVFVVDVSGSMNGFPLDVTKKLMRDLIGRLRPSDRFDVLLFAGSSQLFAPSSVPATQAQVDAAIAFIDRQSGGGGTELQPALARAMALPHADTGISRSFVVVTDGYIAEEPSIFEHVRKHLGEANVFAFGIGTSVNRHLIEGVAKAGQGEPFVVTSEAEAATAATRFRAYIQQPVLTNVRVAYDGFQPYDVEPRQLPDVFAQRPVVLFGKYRGTPTGSITLTGVSGHGRFVSKLDVGAAHPDAKNQALAYLWARTRIANLSDFYQGDAHRDEVVALGLTYNLLTPYTSFIAVQQLVRAAGGSTDVAQPLPMPAGVSDDALGMEVGPEPTLPILLALVGLVLAAGAWRRRVRGLAS